MKDAEKHTTDDMIRAMRAIANEHKAGRITRAAFASQCKGIFDQFMRALLEEAKPRR